MICPTCHGRGLLYNGLLQEHRPCVDCNGSGFVYCCEHYDDHLTHGVTMKEAVIRIEYRDYDTNSDQSGWYVFEYKTLADMADEIPCDVTGPFMTRAAASRNVLEASDLKDRREREHKHATSTSTSTNKADAD
jgi:DnaJ-class molecular chaperone